MPSGTDAEAFAVCLLWTDLMIDDPIPWKQIWLDIVWSSICGVMGKKKDYSPFCNCCSRCVAHIHSSVGLYMLQCPVVRDFLPLAAPVTAAWAPAAVSCTSPRHKGLSHPKPTPPSVLSFWNDSDRDGKESGSWSGHLQHMSKNKTYRNVSNHFSLSDCTSPFKQFNSSNRLCFHFQIDKAWRTLHPKFNNL